MYGDDAYSTLALTLKTRREFNTAGDEQIRTWEFWRTLLWFVGLGVAEAEPRSAALSRSTTSLAARTTVKSHIITIAVVLAASTIIKNSKHIARCCHLHGEHRWGINASAEIVQFLLHFHSDCFNIIKLMVMEAIKNKTKINLFLLSTKSKQLIKVAECSQFWLTVTKCVSKTDDVDYVLFNASSIKQPVSKCSKCRHNTVILDQ